MKDEMFNLIPFKYLTPYTDFIELNVYFSGIKIHKKTYRSIMQILSGKKEKSTFDLNKLNYFVCDQPSKKYSKVLEYNL